MGRILPLGFFVGALLMAGSASAQDKGGYYDWQTGTYTTWSADSDGTTRMRDSNWGTGTSGKSVIRPDGSSQGTDKGGNRWNHNAQSGYYFDFSTGKSCFQKVGVDTC